jgi:hypothetical protein
LGYALKDGKLTVVEHEAERVRMIFRRYLEVSGINELVRDLRTKNICTKAKTFSSGKTRGGIPFGRGALSYFLRNRFFIGEVLYRGEILPGEQPAILDRALFEVVQEKLFARGRQWLDEIIEGSVIDAEQLAKRERCTARQINLTLSLAFLSPQLVKAAVEGRLPRGINIERLRDFDSNWTICLAKKKQKMKATPKPSSNLIRRARSSIR